MEGQEEKRGQDNRTRSIIAVLIAASVAVVALQTPFHVVSVLWRLEHLAFTITLWLKLSNTGTSFYLYVLSGQIEFRLQFLRLFRRKQWSETIRTA
jgi:hypothetical protein